MIIQYQLCPNFRVTKLNLELQDWIRYLIAKHADFLLYFFAYKFFAILSHR
jgi:hypothetical protein